MLYPNQYFYNDENHSFDESNLTADPNVIPYLSLKNKKFAQTLKRAHEKMTSPNAVFDHDTKILFAYQATNALIKRRFKKFNH